MVSFILGQHVLEYGAMSFSFAVLEVCFRANGCQVNIMGLCKIGYFIGVQFCAGIYDQFMWCTGPHQPRLQKAFQEGIGCT
jgi:hypothetical protein